MQLLSYVHCFIGFIFAFEIDHVQQEGKRTENGGHSNSFGGARPANFSDYFLNICTFSFLHFQTRLVNLVLMDHHSITNL